MGKDNGKNQRIQVFARCRPISTNERRQSSAIAVETNNERKEVRVSDDKMINKAFIFDKVFGPEAKQISVYKTVVAPLIREVLTGYNCTVFAYGQTGTGKTFTMEGERTNSSCSWEEDPNAGLIPRALHQLFEELSKEEQVSFSVRVSFLELYNEELFDLLSQSEVASLSKLRLFEDASRKGSVVIQGLEEILVKSKDDVYTILERGTARRQTAATALNATSSRSHTVFSVTVFIRETTIDGEELLKTGKLNLVDLAGSENIGRSGASQKTAREAGSINQSLLTLGRVITALVEKAPHVPYRESKLTRLLQDSLGGHTKTSIIATVSPALINIEETLSTLDYAFRAKNITIKPEVNQKMIKKALLKDYLEEIDRLRKELNAQREQRGAFMEWEAYNTMLQTISSKTNEVIELTENLKTVKIEKKKELMEKEDELCKKAMQLKATSKTLNETCEKLLDTEETLKYTKQVLKDTTLDRDRKQYVITVQKEDGKQLFKQTESLLHVVDESTSDVMALHDKIERKKIVENTNLDYSTAFRVNIQNHLVEVQDGVTNVVKQQTETLQAIRNRNDETIRAYNCQYSSVTSLLKFIDLQQREFSKVMSDVVDVYSNVRTMKSCDVLQLVEVQLKKYAEMQQIIAQNIADVRSLAEVDMHALESQLNQSQKDICEKIAENSTLMTTVYSAQSQILSNIMTDCDKFDLKMSDKMKHKKKCMEEMWKERENIFQSIQKFDKHFLDLTNVSESVSNDIEDCFSTIKGEVNQISNQLEEMKISSSSINQALNECVDESIEKASINTKNISNCLGSLTGNIVVQLQDLDMNQQQNLKVLKADTDDAVAKDSEFKQNCEKLCQEHQLSLETAVREKEVELQEERSNIITFVQSCSDATDGLLHFLPQEYESIKNTLLRSDNLVEKYVTEELVKDIATGLTPIRKTYEYPKHLKCIKSPSVIEEELQSKMDLADVAVNLPFLDSSAEEPSENTPQLEEKIPIPQDLAASDSDSSISSQISDASYDCGKNKENNPVAPNSSIPKRIPKKKLQQKRSKHSSNKLVFKQPVFSSSENILNEK